MKVDSEAAKSFVGRRGLGRMRHIEVRDLWLQEEVRNGKVKVEKILGTENPSDLMTKCLKKCEVIKRLGGLGIEWREKEEVTKGKVEEKSSWADLHEVEEREGKLEEVWIEVVSGWRKKVEDVRKNAEEETRGAAEEVRKPYRWLRRRGEEK